MAKNMSKSENLLNNPKKEKRANRNKNIEMFIKVFWLFMFGSVAGVLLEGIWYYIQIDKLEIHVSTVWGPFSIIYGIGFSVLYLCGKMFKKKNPVIRFLFYAALMDLVELGSGALIEYGLGMRAWNYSKRFLNLNGHICLKMTIIWGVSGIVFERLIIPLWDNIWKKVSKVFMSKTGKIITAASTIFIIFNMLFTILCFVRWSDRHYSTRVQTNITNYIDKHYNDEFMENKFAKWRFIDNISR